MLFGIDDKEYINENSLPLVAEGGVKVLSEHTEYYDNFQKASETGFLNFVPEADISFFYTLAISMILKERLLK